MAVFGVRLLLEPLRSIAFGDIPAAYDINNTMQDANGNIALSHPARWITLHNQTDKSMFFSLNGVDDHMFLPAAASGIYDIASNKQDSNALFLGNGEVLYVRYESAPSTGTVYFEVAYAKGD